MHFFRDYGPVGVWKSLILEFLEFMKIWMEMPNCVIFGFVVV
jgi:hypothetical protein